ncbi:FeoB-associated Cys-rich membrane protein [Prevotella sp. P2-180]|uniref:FeoB-associated Cys-rich membrane protein n=1 Tax=Prevotella sp. P2-180 TaxID=2024224 RepID=UPI000B96C6D6|nr:hypothetical protein CIK98_05440 [Prevotella sp. P2-180]
MSLDINMDVQNIITTIVVALSIAYALYRIVKLIFGKGHNGCDDCGHCKKSR